MRMTQKGGWEYDDAEGGYLLETDNGYAYILGNGRKWYAKVNDYKFETKSLKAAKESASHVLATWND